MRIRFPHSTLIGCVVPLIALAFTASACTSPVAPGALSPLSQESASRLVPDTADRVTTNRVVNSFSLLNGSFTLTLRAADGTAGTVTGTYTGQAVAAVPGQTTAALTLNITGRTGVGSIVSGIQAEGTGAFIGEGNFSLSLALALATTKSPDTSRATLRGTSQVSCSASHQILVTQHGTDATPKFLEITIDLRHEVGQAGC